MIIRASSKQVLFPNKFEYIDPEWIIVREANTSEVLGFESYNPPNSITLKSSSVGKLLDITIEPSTLHDLTNISKISIDLLKLKYVAQEILDSVLSKELLNPLSDLIEEYKHKLISARYIIFENNQNSNYLTEIQNLEAVLGMTKTAVAGKVIICPYPENNSVIVIPKDDRSRVLLDDKSILNSRSYTDDVYPIFQFDIPLTSKSFVLIE